LAVRPQSYHFAKFHKNPLIDLLYRERFRRILDMISLRARKNSSLRVALDLGFGSGHFSRVLCELRFPTIGLDVNKRFQVKEKSVTLNFILADILSLPFRKNSADLIVCASVLEHIRELDVVAKEIKDVLKKDAIFIAGYPVETRLFKFVWRLISPWSFRFIDQNQTYWRNPHTGKQECYWKNPYTHKQDYKTIRHALRTHFQILQKEKLPLNILPDSITYYECIKCRMKEDDKVLSADERRERA
jgi:SAM-dependent methyltransferase